MKIRPVGAETLHADGWTNRHDEANSGFSQFDEGASEPMSEREGKPADCLPRL